MGLQGTNDVINLLNDFYLEHYKEALFKYKVVLEFATILTYYSGSCALVLNILSIPEANTCTNMCIMMECNEKDLQNLNEEALYSFFDEKIIKQHAGLLELNRVLCSKRIHRKVIIKNTNVNEGILNIKLDKEVIQIELNYNKIVGINDADKDLLMSIEALTEHLSK
ncbi:MAG: hypothetical protein K0Q99_1509 [Clostridia bacterium]|nr:hypothetical protein [Clostridia bacterium]